MNPFSLIHKLPIQKQKYQKLGIHSDKEINEAFRNKEYGLSVMVSGGGIIGVVFVLLVSLSNLSINLLNINVELNGYFFIFFGIISLALCHFFVFKNGKYLEYFNKYEGLDNRKMKNNVWMSLGFMLGVILLLFVSLLC